MKSPFPAKLSKLAATALTALLSVTAPIQAADYLLFKGNYVRALMHGDADRIATTNTLEWDETIQRNAAQMKLKPHDVVGMLKSELVEKPNLTGSEKERVESARNWERMLQRDLKTTFPHRLIFRIHYVYAFATEIDRTCRFLPLETAEELIAAMNGATAWTGKPADTALDSILLPDDTKDALKTLATSISQGKADAENVISVTKTCANPDVRKIIATLTKLLSPLQPSAKPDAGRTRMEMSAIIAKNTGSPFVDGFYFRHRPLEGPYDTAIAASRNEPAIRIPGPADEIPGQTIGWDTTRDALDAAKVDRKPLLFLFVPNGRCVCDMLLDLLTSREFNALAGQFHAVLLMTDDDPNSLYSVMRRNLKPMALPAVVLMKMGTETSNANWDWQRVLEFSGASLAKALPPALGIPPPPARMGHSVSTRLPPFCWMIETYGMCQARLRRSAHQE